LNETSVRGIVSETRPLEYHSAHARDDAPNLRAAVKEASALRHLVISADGFSYATRARPPSRPRRPTSSGRVILNCWLNSAPAAMRFA